jgi:hypothetical protein
LTDPQNDTSHRLLANAYQHNGTPLENARASEWLQAQLRQAVHAEPVATQALTSHLPLVHTPRTWALHDASSSLRQSRQGARLSLMGGNSEHFASSANAWLSLGDSQLSVGHFQYRTQQRFANTVAINPPLQLRTHNLLWHTQLTPQISGQAELRRQHRQGTELIQSLAQSSTVTPQTRRTIDADIARLGLRATPAVDTEWLGSLIHTTRQANSTDQTAVGPGRINSTDALHRSALLSELMLTTVQTPPLRFTVGFSSLREHAKNDVSISFINLPSPPLPSTHSQAIAKHQIAFGYGQWQASPTLAVHAGLSQDDYAYKTLHLHHTHPKLGAQWQASPTLKIKLAAYGTTTGSTLKEQTIEPTSFSGFNQRFDDLQGTPSKQWALGLEHKLTADTQWGAQIMHRRMRFHLSQLSAVLIPTAASPATSPATCPNSICQIDATEQHQLLHLSTRVHPQAALYTALQRAQQTAHTPSNLLNMPHQLSTWQLRSMGQYFSPRHWSAYLQARAIKQSASNNRAGSPITNNQFLLLDTGVRYQPAHHRFSIFFDAANLLNRQFNFQNTATGGVPRTPLFQSGRSLTAGLALRL